MRTILAIALIVAILNMTSVVGLGQPPIPDNVGVPDASSDGSIAAEASAT